MDVSRIGKPQKRIIGYIMTGAMFTAVTSLSKMLDIKYKKEAAC
jgi:hypothetical protein